MEASQVGAKIMGRMFSVVPAIVITAGLDKINPFARFGLLLGPLPTVLAKYSTYNAKGNPPTEKRSATSIMVELHLDIQQRVGSALTLTNLSACLGRFSSPMQPGRLT
jgi:hypothetical protein